MTETTKLSNNSGKLPDNSVDKKAKRSMGPIKKLATIGSIFLTLNASANNLDNSSVLPDGKEVKIELATALQGNSDAFQYGTELGDEKKDNIRNIGEMSIDFIGQNFYINGHAAKEFNIERVGEKEYSIDYNIEGDKLLKVIVKCNYSSTSITFDKDIKVYLLSKKSGNRIKYDETQGISQLDKFANNFKVNGKNVKAEPIMYGDKIYFKVGDDVYVYKKGDTNDSVSNFDLSEKLIKVDIERSKNEGEFGYDSGINNNTYVTHLSMKNNPYKDENLIKSTLAEKTIKYKESFKDSYPELGNFQLSRLNKPNLGKEVYKDNDGNYYRELYYQDNGDYIKVMNVYFDEKGEIDIEKTNNSMENSDLFKKGDCGINENGEFFISDEYVEDLVQQLIIDRGVLINMINTDKVVSTEDFPGLKKEIMGDIWAPNPKIITYNPITGKFGIGINNQEKLPCKVDNGTVIIVDETGKPTNNSFYYNFGKKYYRVSIKDGKLSVEIIDKPGENPRKTLPNYLGDPAVKSILNSDGVLTKISSDGIEYFDKNTGKFIGKIPCKKEDDGTWKVLDEYSVNLNFLDLYNDESFEAKRKQIEDLCKELGIVDVDIRNIFENKLKNSGVDFNLKDVKITHPESKYGKYYKMSDNFNNSKDVSLYNTAEKCLNEIISRLENVKTINDCKILRVHGKEVKDFQEFIGLESKDYESEEALNKFIRGESNEIKVKIRRGNGQEAIVNYSVIGNVFRSWFTGEGKTYFSDQWYKLDTDEEGNIIFKVIAGKKDK